MNPPEFLVAICLLGILILLAFFTTLPPRPPNPPGPPFNDGVG